HVAEPVLLRELREVHRAGRGRVRLQDRPELHAHVRYCDRPRLRKRPSPFEPRYSPPSTMTLPRESTVSTCPSTSKPSHAEWSMFMWWVSALIVVCPFGS